MAWAPRLGHIWPISLSMEGLTTSHKAEKALVLNLLVNTGRWHQPNARILPWTMTVVTLEWFSWSNMMFCELLLDYFDIRVKR